MARFRWRHGERKGAWKPTRREALAAAQEALRKSARASGRPRPPLDTVEIEERQDDRPI